MNKLSTGQPNTLGSYYDNCKAVGFTKAMEFFEKRIADSPHGRDEEVLQDESQMMYLVYELQRGRVA